MKGEAIMPRCIVEVGATAEGTGAQAAAFLKLACFGQLWQQPGCHFAQRVSLLKDCSAVYVSKAEQCMPFARACQILPF